jgi:hypothetical protein
MKLYFKSGMTSTKMSRIIPCINHFIKKDNYDKLYTYSISYELRKNLCKSVLIPTYKYDINLKDYKKFSKFISNSIHVYVNENENKFLINIPYEEINILPILLNFLDDQKSTKNHTIYINSEFSNSDILFMNHMLRDFPNRNIFFRLSDLEFSYLKVNEVKDDTLYTETSCFYERLEHNFPEQYEKNLFYYKLNEDKLNEDRLVEDQLKPDIDIKKFFKVYDKNLGLITHNYRFPKSIEKDSIIILE